MNNVHPIYKIKELMIKRELARDPKLKNESWERFLPQFKSKTISKRKQPKKKKIKKPYTPFPPPQTESKIDKELASGQYFLQEGQKKAIKRRQTQEKHSAAKKKKDEERSQPFVPPKEGNASKKTKTNNSDVDVESLKLKVKKSMAKKKPHKG